MLNQNINAITDTRRITFLTLRRCSSAHKLRHSDYTGNVSERFLLPVMRFWKYRFYENIWKRRQEQKLSNLKVETMPKIRFLCLKRFKLVILALCYRVNRKVAGENEMPYVFEFLRGQRSQQRQSDWCLRFLWLWLQTNVNWFSEVKLVKNKLRTSMSDSRLTGLMLLTCEKDLTETRSWLGKSCKRVETVEEETISNTLKHLQIANVSRSSIYKILIRLFVI
jgi:site-specific recombinase XerD